MPSPPGDLALLCRSLQSTSSLLGFARVLPGKNALASKTPPPRLVMFPVAANNGTADDRTVTVSSGWMLVTAHFWATDGDNAFDLRQRWFQAMRAQADAGGYFWKSPEGNDERWDIEPDPAQQGQEFEIDVLIRIDANLPTQSMGTVEATSLNRVQSLSADMDAGDAAASVDATIGAPVHGVLHIDDEQMSYSSIAAASFIGLVRGIHGTAAAAHASGAAVYVSPT